MLGRDSPGHWKVLSAALKSEHVHNLQSIINANHDQLKIAAEMATESIFPVEIAKCPTASVEAGSQREASHVSQGQNLVS